MPDHYFRCCWKRDNVSRVTGTAEKMGKDIENTGLPSNQCMSDTFSRVNFI